jgi:hypothetical protein
MKKVAELKDNEVRAIVYLDVTGDYTFEARLLSFDDQEGEVIRRVHGLTLSAAMKEMMLTFIAEWEGAPGESMFKLVQENVKLA